eukprot:TRINITY_DN6524_c0_g1_i3.p1 TRINITY_DN6524_c0_g1~~TRINITY_DN6524_c0_g1_i3.p1  ORF type:complete len:516 (-),score=86.92 TRINITY_DN6524_c0_g1_i3:177-1667(-)
MSVLKCKKGVSATWLVGLLIALCGENASGTRSVSSVTGANCSAIQDETVEITMGTSMLASRCAFWKAAMALATKMEQEALLTVNESEAWHVLSEHTITADLLGLTPAYPANGEVVGMSGWSLEDLGWVTNDRLRWSSESKMVEFDEATWLPTKCPSLHEDDPRLPFHGPAIAWLSKSFRSYDQHLNAALRAIAEEAQSLGSSVPSTVSVPCEDDLAAGLVQAQRIVFAYILYLQELDDSVKEDKSLPKNLRGLLRAGPALDCVGEATSGTPRDEVKRGICIRLAAKIMSEEADEDGEAEDDEAGQESLWLAKVGNDGQIVFQEVDGMSVLDALSSQGESSVPAARDNASDYEQSTALVQTTDAELALRTRFSIDMWIGLVNGIVGAVQFMAFYLRVTISFPIAWTVGLLPCLTWKGVQTTLRTGCRQRECNILFQCTNIAMEQSLTPIRAGLGYTCSSIPHCPVRLRTASDFIESMKCGTARECVQERCKCKCLRK